MSTVHPISLYNTLSRSVETVTPVDGSQTIRMYSCGPTVYNVAHIGNMRAFVAADVLQRVLRTVGGYEVRWVMNITDIDDKTIRDSSETSDCWLPAMGSRAGDAHGDLRTFTAYWMQEFLHDIQTLGIRQDHLAALPRATDYIQPMQQLVVDIFNAGYAYVSQGSVYFNVGAYAQQHAYGRLYTIDREHFREGVRIDADEYDRESVSDFVLWKAQKDGEPAWDLHIDGQVLPGRPGWHLECSAMSHELLSPFPIDIHTGGVDLRFPHHEDELAQCCAGYHVPDQSHFWVHNEFLEVDGRKMSKSLGNYYTLRDLLDKGLDPLDIRFALLSAHYRTVLNFTFEGVRAAAAARRRVQEYIWDLVDRTDGYEVVDADAPNPLQEVFQELANDVHTPKALAALHTFINVHPVEEMDEHEAARVLYAFGLLNSVVAVWTAQPRPEIEIPDDVLDLADARWEARLAKNWAEADRLRDALVALGWHMKDGKDGYDILPLEPGT